MPGPARRPGSVNRRELGRQGEEAAVETLRALGYRIMERNVRLRRGELDVVADDRGVLVFVEIKARRSSRFGTPAEAVTVRKRRALVALAAAYLVRLGGPERPCRFDVAGVWIERDGGPSRVEVVRDAFGTRAVAAAGGFPNGRETHPPQRHVSGTPTASVDSSSHQAMYLRRQP